MHRRRFLPLLGAGLTGLPQLASAKVTLPMATVFKGGAQFERILKKALADGWQQLPIGERMTRVALELRGTPYQNWTLEIHDKIESPSVNFEGLDCWTFFETCLGFARMIGWRRERYEPANLLQEIEFTRYRGGVCSGDYLERIHYLAEWFFENEARGVADDITRDLGGAERIRGRKIQEMTVLWKSYRYLKNNPELRPRMAASEKLVAQLPVYYLPKSKVARIEDKLQNGDIAGIATKHHGGFCSHVGQIIRTKDGVARFFHASRDSKKVLVDSSISEYLNRYSKHAGVIIARPLDNSKTVTDPAQYRRNLARLTS